MLPQVWSQVAPLSPLFHCSGTASTGALVGAGVGARVGASVSRRQGRFLCRGGGTPTPFEAMIGPDQGGCGGSGVAPHAAQASPVLLGVVVLGGLAVRMADAALHALAPMAFTFAHRALGMVGAGLEDTSRE